MAWFSKEFGKANARARIKMKPIFIFLLSFILVISSVNAEEIIDYDSNFRLPSFSFILNTPSMAVVYNDYNCGSSTDPYDYKQFTTSTGNWKITKSSTSNVESAYQVTDMTAGKVIPPSECQGELSSVLGKESCLLQSGRYVRWTGLDTSHQYIWAKWNCVSKGTLSHWCLSTDKTYCYAKDYPSGYNIPSTCYINEDSCKSKVIEPCTDTCYNIGYDCGEQYFCGGYNDCGDCSFWGSGFECKSGKCVNEQIFEDSKCCYSSGVNVNVEDIEKKISIINLVGGLLNQFRIVFGEEPIPYIEYNKEQIKDIKISSGYFLIAKDESCNTDWNSKESEMVNCLEKNINKIGESSQKITLTKKDGTTGGTEILKNVPITEETFKEYVEIADFENLIKSVCSNVDDCQTIEGKKVTCNGDKRVRELLESKIGLKEWLKGFVRWWNSEELPVRYCLVQEIGESDSEVIAFFSNIGNYINNHFYDTGIDDEGLGWVTIIVGVFILLYLIMLKK